MNTVTVLKALGEPMRFKIFSCLLERKHCVSSLSKKLGITESAISQHLKVMREADIIYSKKYGYHTHYFPKQVTLDNLVEVLIKMKQQSFILDRDMTVCQCEYKKEEQK